MSVWCEAAGAKPNGFRSAHGRCANSLQRQACDKGAAERICGNKKSMRSDGKVRNARLEGRLGFIWKRGDPPAARLAGLHAKPGNNDTFGMQ